MATRRTLSSRCVPCCWLLAWAVLACATPEAATQPAVDAPPQAWLAAETVFTPGSMAAGPVWAESAVLAAPAGASRIGLLVDTWTPEDAAVVAKSLEVRGFDKNKQPLDWAAAQVTWQDGAAIVARRDSAVDVYAAQLRVPSAQLPRIAHVTFSALVPEADNPEAHATDADSGDDSATGYATKQAPLSSVTVQPRSVWGAKPTKCKTADAKKSHLAIHHTDTPPTSAGSYAARIKSIQAYHMDTRGWCDIGYHFLVTDDGSVWEGRPLPLLGSHVLNHNAGNIGVSFVGCYHPGECDAMGTMHPSQATLTGATALLADLTKQYGIDPNAKTILPHRGHTGAQTTCPGDYMVEALAGLIAAAKAGTQAPKPVAVTPGHVRGVVWDKASAAQPTLSGAKLLDTATVTIGDTKLQVKAVSAYFELVLPPGTYSVTVSAPGYLDASQPFSVAAGGDTWASVALSAKPADAVITPDNCGKLSGQAEFACASDGNSRARCVAGNVVSEACANGCLVVASGEDVCMGTAANWSCPATWSTSKAGDGNYAASAFGCWLDSAGKAHSDPGDNCIPGCLAQLQKAGTCVGQAGPACEQALSWFAADAGRFGCGAKLRVRNPKNGKSVVVVAIDNGPNCSVEKKISLAVLDLSYPANNYLFGGQVGSAEKVMVHAVEVAADTPLGPVN